MSGDLRSGSADRARAPQPPDKPPVSPDAQKSQQDHPANQAAHPDGRQGKDNQGPAGPQGGKAPDIGGPKGDAASHQADNKTGGTHRSGDGPVKISEVPGPRNTDGPHRGADQPPGPRAPTDFAAWKAQYESHSAPHPDTATRPASEVKLAVELPPLKYSHTLDLAEKVRDSHGNLTDKDKYRDSDGKLDWGKVRADLNRITHQGVDKAQHEQRRPGGTPGSRELRIQPVDITVHLQHAKSDTEIVQVRAVFKEVAQGATNWEVRTHVDRLDPHPHQPDIPGPKTQPETRPGPGGTRRGPEQSPSRREHQEVHPQSQAPRQVPPVRQMPPVTPHSPWR
jgi:hypothetical protein